MRVRRADGFALIDLIFVCGIIGVLCSVALPHLFHARQSAGSASAIGSMRAINSAQLTYALTCGAGFYAPTLVVLGTAPPGSREAFITAGLGTGVTVTRSGYVIQLAAEPFAGAPLSCNMVPAGEGGRGFKAGADPADPQNARFFATNANNVIYENTSTMYPTMPEIGEPGGGAHVLR